ncbi:hypothetical protein C8F01DRAFT_1311106 [Mycena amicta]|nr:hypothetical protein C8F01DRAFT_1311106 [Mycena amicta]
MEIITRCSVAGRSYRVLLLLLKKSFLRDATPVPANNVAASIRGSVEPNSNPSGGPSTHQEGPTANDRDDGDSVPEDAPDGQSAKGRKGKSKSKSKPGLSKTERLQRNGKNWAAGVREDNILRPKWEQFMAAKLAGGPSLKAFFTAVQNEFIVKIGWRLADDVEPNLPLPVYDLTAAPVVELLSEEEEKAKEERIALLCARIKRWYLNRLLTYNKAKKKPAVTTAGRSGPVKTSQLPKVEDVDEAVVFVANRLGLPPPKRTNAGYQFYMTESFATEIAPVVARQWKDRLTTDSTPGDSNAPPPPELGAKVALEMFNELDPERQEDLRARAKEIGRQAKEEYTEKLKAWPPRTPEFHQKAQDLLEPLMDKLLRAISDATGMHLFLVMGGPVPRYGGEMRTIQLSVGANHAPVPVPFPQWDAAHWEREIVDKFKAYLETAFTPSECLAFSLNKEDIIDDPSLLTLDENDPPIASSSKPQTTTKRKAKSKSKLKGGSDAATTNASGSEGEDAALSSASSGMEEDQSLPGSEPEASESEDDGMLVDPTDTAAPASSEEPRPPSAMSETPAEPISSTTTTTTNLPTPTTTTTTLPTPTTTTTTTATTPTTPTPAPSTSVTSSRGGGLRRMLAVDAAKRVTAIPACPARTSTSQWLCNVYSELTNVNLGAAYNDALAAYLALEAAYGYANGTGRLSAEHRPAQMQRWIRNKRVATPAYCGISDATAFAKSYWAWWMGIQPSWREITQEIRPVSADRGSESWGALVVPGINGMLTAVAMLYWWGCEEKTQQVWPTPDWVDALEDLRCVCEGLRDEAEDEGRQAKKRKR